VTTAPSTYAAWAETLRAFEAGGADDATLRAMEEGNLELTGGAADRLYQRVLGVLDARLVRIVENLKRHLGSLRDEGGIEMAILAARRELRVMTRFASCPSWPENLRGHLTRSLEEFVSRAQSSLEESAREAQRSDGGRMLATLRRTPLRA